jgi:hypothetical protein
MNAPWYQLIRCEKMLPRKEEEPGNSSLKERRLGATPNTQPDEEKDVCGSLCDPSARVADKHQSVRRAIPVP